MKTPRQLFTGLFRRPQQGFALVITLSLMILLTIIAVGLLTLSSIALRASTHGKAMRTAQENARMALMLAIGELQKYAGPDQRLTATADIAGAADGSALAAGAAPLNDKSINGKTKGLSSVQPGTRYWTGVFANQDTPATIYTKTPSPTIVHWLVSGNTSTYPAGGPSILPADVTYAVGPNGSVSDADKAVVLVGRNSVGNSADSPDHCVAVPLVNVLGKDVKSGKVTANPVARFAWWIGDEGVKAKINIAKTFEDKTNYAALPAQRRGWETVDGFSDYPTPVKDRNSLPKIITLGETSLLMPNVRAAGDGTCPLQNVFHSATTDSRAVLTDTLRGGTKIDLTTILAGTLPGSNPVATIDNYPVKNKNIIPSIKTSNCDTTKLIAPKWDAIKEFSDRSQSLDGGSLIVKAAASDTVAAIAPLITDFRILMGAKITNPATNSFTVSACGKIAVAIANPYSRTLKWKDDIEIELRNQTPVGNQPSRIWSMGDRVYIQKDASEPSVFNNAFFRIQSSSLAPGEARAYTNAGEVKRTTGTATQRVVVDLVPVDATSAGNFNFCVFLENTETRGDIPSMDVRESWQTTLALIEMRTNGSLLRRVERLELDNGYFGNNTRNLSNAEAAQCALSSGGPVGLMLYIFQLSQPGWNYLYEGYLPAGYDMGQRNSTLRTFTDFNLQATHVRKLIASYAPPPYFMFSTNGLGQLGGPPGGDTGGLFTKYLPSPCRWGRSSISGSDRTILFSVPSQIASIAQLQHADLTGDDLQASIGHQPGNAVGNSYATPFVKRGQLSQSRPDYEIVGSPNSSSATWIFNNYYDIAYLLNAALWDSYFFSTIPRTGSSTPENPSLIRIGNGDASNRSKDPLAAATSFMIDGAFNCNSTNPTAWKAFLASSKHFKHAADSGTNTEAAFPRTLEQISPSASPPTGNDADSFSGFRRLTDKQLDALATEIVKQVRIRGPFVSLSHFVNRTLADLKTKPALTRCGALQSAIDESGANINFTGDKKKNAFSLVDATIDRVTLLEKENAPRADFDGSDTGGQLPNADPSVPDWGVTSTDNNFGAVASVIADRELIKDSTYKPEQGFRSTGIPGWLTQADVLQVIGPSLTTRSDTFRIRSYGEALDTNGIPIARAYCEAVVQRVPSYIDPANEPSARGDQLSTLNTKYGRQFEIVAFRWLSPNEI